MEKASKGKGKTKKGNKKQEDEEDKIQIPKSITMKEKQVCISVAAKPNAKLNTITGMYISKMCCIKEQIMIW